MVWLDDLIDNFNLQQILWFSPFSQLSVLDWSLFAPSLREVTVARLSWRHWSTGRWLLGKSACERKGWGRQSHGRDSVLTSGTCRNRYIYGWRLCTVTDFPCPLEQRNESHHLCSNSVSQWSSMHVEIHIEAYSLHTITSEKNLWLFPTTGKQLHKKNPQTIQTALPSISHLKVVPAELQLKESQVKH